MEDRYLELEPITPVPESTEDSNKTLEIIEELGRDLDALENAAPRRDGFFLNSSVGSFHAASKIRKRA